MENKISVVINTYNAEKQLRLVLDALKGFDEVVICDMESMDNTLSIAREYGCKIVTFEKKDITIVEPARNFAIQSASNEWVLVVDADEIVTDELRGYLYDQIALPNPPDGIYIPRRNYFMGQFMHALYPDYILRFFKKSKTDWPPVIHVQPTVSGTVIRAPRNVKGLAFEHLADDSVSDRLRKTDTYTDYECIKKAHKHYGLWAFIARPTHRFLKSYILKAGFRDGLPGFIYACLEATYQVVMMAKLKEQDQHIHRV